MSSEIDRIAAELAAAKASLQAVREELWVDECLRRNNTRRPEGDWAMRPVIRIIDAALAGSASPAPVGEAGANQQIERLWRKAFNHPDTVELAASEDEWAWWRSLLAASPSPAPTQALDERIVRAAVLWNGGVYSLPAPKRHGDAIAMLPEGAFVGPEDQGFVTSTGAFVSRHEAREIAKAAGQIIRHSSNNPTDPELYSEDVW